MKRFVAALMALGLAVIPVPGHSQQRAQFNSTPVQANSLAGTCPSWSYSSSSQKLSGVSWSRSGARKIYLEWSLSPSKLDGMPVSRKFTADEADQIRAAVSWWDAVFETIEFREVSGDYAPIKIGATPSVKEPTSKYWYFSRPMKFLRGQIAIPTSARAQFYSDHVSYLESAVRRELADLLGAGSAKSTIPELQSRLRHLYGENSCYPIELDARWDASSGLQWSNPLAEIGSTQRVELFYRGLSQIAATSLTPNVCRTANFSVTPQAGVLVNITGQGVCSVLLQAREGSLPSSTEVLTIRTGFAQKILVSGIPKTLKVGRTVTLKPATTSGTWVALVSGSKTCKIEGEKVTGLRPGKCQIRASAEGIEIGQFRFISKVQTYAITVTR